MATSSKSDKTTPTPARKSVRVSSELYDRLQTAADERMLSTAFLVDYLLSEGLTFLIPANELRLSRRSLADPEPSP